MAPSAVDIVPAEDIIIRAKTVEQVQALKFSTETFSEIPTKEQDDQASQASEHAITSNDHTQETITEEVIAPEHVPEASTPFTIPHSSPLDSAISTPPTEMSELAQDEQAEIEHVAIPKDDVTETTSTPNIIPASVPTQLSLPSMISPDNLALADRILKVILRYKLPRAQEASEDADEGYLKFLSMIYIHVKARRAIPLCLPAFPFKSPNAISKVLGKLPDMAEDLALAHLNGLCLSIQDIYEPGAQLTIISDGLVYNGKIYKSDVCFIQRSKPNSCNRLARRPR